VSDHLLRVRPKITTYPLTDVAASYLINIIVLVFVYLNWRKIIALRYTWFRSDEYNKSFYARTLMVLNVPKKIQSDSGLEGLFAGLQMPYPTTSVHIGHQVGQLPELIEFHNETVRDFEQVLVRYLKGGKIGKKRPQITNGGCLGLGGEKRVGVDLE
jgi:calcium permeable stress-gated cation channel